ncbi:MAG: hypothetical protein ACREC4_00395 [Methylocella sp.]
MRRPGGWLCISTDGANKEFDTFTCRHCGTIVVVPHKCRPDDLGGLCTVCGGLVCPQCIGKGCTPMERRLEQMEAAAATRRIL